MIQIGRPYSRPIIKRPGTPWLNVEVFPVVMLGIVLSCEIWGRSELGVDELDFFFDRGEVVFDALDAALHLFDHRVARFAL